MFFAKIKWLTKEQGGRKTLPVGNNYAPIILLKNEEFDSQKQHWSLIVENIETISNCETLAKVKYLSDKAPKNLFNGTEFKLYEGIKLVAKGIITKTQEMEM